MNKSEIIATQTRVGATPDGFWGPKSTAAAKRHLKKLMPSPHPFPTQSQVRSDRSIFGRRGVKNGYSPPGEKIKLPFPLYYVGNRQKRVLTLEPHPLCAQEMLRVFERLEQAFPTQEERIAVGITAYYGIYNPRNTRGGNSPSMHSYKIAIDQDAGRNKNRAHWPVSSKMPIEVMECFAAEGFLSAGAFWSRDAMHHQATKA